MVNCERNFATFLDEQRTMNDENINDVSTKERAFTKEKHHLALSKSHKQHIVSHLQ